MQEKYRPSTESSRRITLKIADFEPHEQRPSPEPITVFQRATTRSEPRKVYAIESKHRRISERIYIRRFSAEGERAGLTLMRKLQGGEDIDWSDEGNIWGEPLGYVIQQVGKDIPAPLVPAPMLVADSAALNGNSLESLYEYAKRRRNRHGESPIAYVRRRAGLELTTEDVIGGFDLGVSLLWNRIPQAIRSDLLERAAEERGKPAKEFEIPDFEHEYDFLNGQDLMRVI